MSGTDSEVGFALVGFSSNTDEAALLLEQFPSSMIVLIDKT